MIWRDEDEDDGVEIRASYRRETELAKLYLLSESKTNLWVPKSVLLDEDEDSITVATWWAEKEGLD